MKKTQLFTFIILFSLVAMNFSQISMAYTGSGTSNISGTLSADVGFENTWQDSQWQFFRTTCGFEQHIFINLSYSGTLDLDLWIFVDETDGDQQNFAIDLSHCELLAEPTLTSAVRTTNTENNPEIIEYTNYDFSVTRDVYILVFTSSGTGLSEYNLSSTNMINGLEGSDVQSCNLIIKAWVIFGIGSVIIFVAVVKLAKYLSKSPVERANERAQKEALKQAKAKKKGKTVKTSNSMAARRGSSNRR